MQSIFRRFVDWVLWWFICKQKHVSAILKAQIRSKSVEELLYSLVSACALYCVSWLDWQSPFSDCDPFLNCKVGGNRIAAISQRQLHSFTSSLAKYSSWKSVSKFQSKLSWARSFSATVDNFLRTLNLPSKRKFEIFPIAAWPTSLINSRSIATSGLGFGDFINLCDGKLPDSISMNFCLATCYLLFMSMELPR